MRRRDPHSRPDARERAISTARRSRPSSSPPISAMLDGDVARTCVGRARRRDHHRRRERAPGRGRSRARRDARRARGVRVRRAPIRAGARSSPPRSRSTPAFDRDAALRALARARCRRTRGRAGSRRVDALPLLAVGQDRSPRRCAALPTRSIDATTADRVVYRARGRAVPRRRGARGVQARDRDRRERVGRRGRRRGAPALGGVSPRERRSSARSSRSPGSRAMLFATHDVRADARSWSIRSSSALSPAALVELLPARQARADAARVAPARARRRAPRARRSSSAASTTRPGRSGLLVYISWLEREVALVPDSGLARDAAGRACSRAPRHALTAAMRARRRRGRARRSRRSRRRWRAAMPHRDDDVNELPDAIDSDMERRVKRSAGSRSLRRVLALAGVALARPGGGESFSGGGGHGGGGGGGGGGGAIFELIYWTLRLFFYYPQIGLPILGDRSSARSCARAYKQHQNKDWDSGPPVELERAVDLARVRRARSRLLAGRVRGLRVPAVLDRASRARDRRRRSRRSRRTSRRGRTRRARRARADGRAGRSRSSSARCACFASTCPTEPTPRADARAHRRRVRGERRDRRAHVLLRRDAGCSAATPRARASRPARAQTFPCPNCGAPWQASGDRHAGVRVVRSGRRQRPLRLGRRADLARVDRRAPADADRPRSPERGTDLPTYARPSDRDAALGRARRAPIRRSTETAFEARLAMIYDAAQQGVVGERARSRCAASSPTGSTTTSATGSTRTSAQGLRNAAHRHADHAQSSSRRSSRDQLVRRGHDPDLGHRQGLRRARARPARSCAARSTASARTASTGR